MGRYIRGRVAGPTAAYVSTRQVAAVALGKWQDARSENGSGTTRDVVVYPSEWFPYGYSVSPCGSEACCARARGGRDRHARPPLGGQVDAPTPLR